MSATASDEAGNTAVTPAAGAFVVDRTGPTVTYRPSEVLDERTRCTVRRRLRALVEARVSVPDQAIQLNVRQRATNATSAQPEVMWHLADDNALRVNPTSFLWETCESPSCAGGSSCTPNIPTTTNSAL